MSETSIYTQLRQNGLSAAGAAGAMGNFKAEGAMRGNNAQDSYGYYSEAQDAAYTAAVDNGSYTNFVNDAVGYGLWQATYGPYKAELLKEAQSRGVSIADERLQVDVFCSLIKYEKPGLWQFLRSSDNVYEAARRICVEFERPADAENKVAERAAAAQEFFNKYAGTEPAMPPDDGGEVPGTDVGKSLYNADMSVLCIGFDGTQLDMLRYILRAQGYDVAPTGPWEETFDEVIEQVQRDLGVTPDRIFGARSFAALLSREPTAKAADSQKKTNILSTLIGKMSRKGKS